MEEIYKLYEDCIYISNLGNMKSLKGEKRIATKNSEGYYIFNVGQKLRNHRLISSNCTGTVDGYGKVFGTKLFGLGKGAYYVQVTYNDQTTETLTGTNVLKKVNKNDTITLLDADNLAADQHEGIDKVTVVFLHSTRANNVLGVGYEQDWITIFFTCSCVNK